MKKNRCQPPASANMLNAAPGPTPEEVTPAMLREQYAALAMPAAVEGVEREDRTIPGPGGPLAIRIYRPVGGGVTPGIVFFHGGGWVIGSHVSDDPLCRDLCHRAGVLIVSVNYRHAPEFRFPAAVDDGYAATKWIAEHAAELGGIPGRVAVAGWSAGGNVAAVTTQMARDAGVPTICGQLLLTPATDGTLDTPSYRENAEGFLLTGALMHWFWDHYCDASQRLDPRAAPLRAASLAGLPPAMVVTCEFDPLRDEGDAYARGLAAAGVPVQHVQAHGHMHTSITMVDVIISGVRHREQMAAALRGFFA